MNLEHLDDEENVEVIRDKYQNNELLIADKVAKELLEKEKDKKDKKSILVLILIFILLTFFVSYAGFSIFEANTGTNDNIIQSGSILFAYNEGSNTINIDGALPMADELGKQMLNDGEYFNFSISAEVNSKEVEKVTYEISATPNLVSLDPKYIRVYLVEDGRGVLINSKDVNNYPDLPNSTIRQNAKLLYKKEVTTSSKSEYTFRMWVSQDYEVDSIKRSFSCFINVDAY